jgi:hypothetical protein
MQDPWLNFDHHYLMHIYGTSLPLDIKNLEHYTPQERVTIVNLLDKINRSFGINVSHVTDFMPKSDVISLGIENVTDFMPKSDA